MSMVTVKKNTIVGAIMPLIYLSVMTCIIVLYALSLEYYSLVAALVWMFLISNIIEFLIVVAYWRKK